jgi:amino-acid N-acetyltransferase
MGSTDGLIEAARLDDLEAVLGLLRAARLPTAGVADAFPLGYVVVRSGRALVATAGLEPHGRVGLLRSVVVVEAQRGAGLGRMMVEDRLRAARERHLEGVYLLTTTAPEYFRRLGFKDTARDAAPDTLRASSEFATICPASASCLVKTFRVSSPSPGGPRL